MLRSTYDHMGSIVTGQGRRPVWPGVQRAPSRALTLAAMVGVIAGVAALGYWDERREYAAALDDFAQEQATLARSVADDIQGRLAQTTAIGDGEVSALLRSVNHLGGPSALTVLAETPTGAILTADGRKVELPELSRALAGGHATVRLAGVQAATLGLPERTAMAGLARLDAGRVGRWGVAVVASAERQRDRERWARLRLILSTALAAALVVGFGGHALRRQRTELELQYELEVSKVERERDERLARLSKAATTVTLASGMAHEISTPLGVISGRAELLSQRVKGDEQASGAALAILEQSQRIKDVVQRFLNLARGGSPTLQDASPAALMDAAVALVEHRLEKAGVRLLRSEAAPLPAVRCDPTLLEQAIVNLLLNACDACSRGGTVEVGARASGDLLTFDVRDDGEGIAERDAPHAGQPFFTTKPQGKGTGLGLAIVNEIAKCHRGSFVIERQQPRGTRASIRLPLERRAV